MTTTMTITPTSLETLWTTRPELAHIEQAARARLASPWAVLGCTLVEVLAAVPPHITLPPLVGGPASLNMFVAIVGGSGLGKGAAISTASSAFNIVSDAPRSGRVKGSRKRSPRERPSTGPTGRRSRPRSCTPNR